MSNVIENRISDSYANRKRERKRKMASIENPENKQMSVARSVSLSTFSLVRRPQKATMYVFYVTQKLTRGRVEKKNQCRVDERSSVIWCMS